tara:strand:- start:3310 stop:3942 length:633 start_codon:yes stop_codon:yes gene_type:complete
MDLESVMGCLNQDGWAVFDSTVVLPEIVIENLGHIIMENDVSIDVGSRSLVRSNKALPPHTDHHLVEYILWYCHEQDVAGGDSILVDGIEVFDRQSQADKDILKSIHLMEHCVFEGDLTQHPMVSEERDNLSLYYSFWMAEGLSELQRNAFDRFTKSVMETEPERFKLPQYWCLVINNKRIFHGRTALSEDSDRFLKRYWISSSKHKKLE